MTTLAAFQGNGFAIIGCDSQASDEGGRVLNLATPKVVSNGEYLIAVTGASRGGNIAQFGWKPPKPPINPTLDRLDKFMTSMFIPSLRDKYIKSGYDGKWDGEAADTESALIVSVRGVIYPIWQDYSWDRDVRNIYYGGSGGDVALGAMVALGIQKLSDNADKATKVIQSAVRLATDWDCYSSSPIITKIQYSRKTK